MIPAKTQPLAKAIRTLEGILVVVSDAAMAVAAVPAVHALNPKVAAACIAVQHVGLLVQRGVIKAKALHLDTAAQALVDDPVSVLNAWEVHEAANPAVAQVVAADDADAPQNG